MSSRESIIGVWANMRKTMTGRESLVLLDSALERLSPDLARRVALDSGMSILNGDTDDNIGPVSFRIGTRELVESPDKAFPIAKAIMPVVNLCHEVLGHGGQILTEFDKATPLSRVLALNHYGCKTSLAYYGIKRGQPTRRYYRQPKEIAAQYVGIKAANLFLSDEYGESEANQMLCRYVRSRIRKRSESLDHSPLRISVPKILAALNKKFIQCLSRRRVYNPKNREKDELRAYAERVGQSELGRKVKSCRDGVRQDLMMASVWIASWDYHDRIKTRPAIANLPWSVDCAFDMSVPLPELYFKRDDLVLGQLYIPDLVRSAKSGPDDVGSAAASNPPG